MENLRDSLIQCVNSKVANFGPHRMPKATRIAQRNKKTNKPSSAVYKQQGFLIFQKNRFQI